MRIPLSALVAIASGLAAANASAQAPAAQSFHPAFELGVTGGGDKLATVTFNDGTSSSIRAGGLLHFGGGVLWQPAYGPAAVQVTLNYHVDDVNADNGSLRFSRYPLEVLGFFTGVQRWRFGAGPRFVFNPRLKVDVGGDNAKIAFKNTIGAVAEVGYDFGTYLWINLRVTAEKYKVKSFNGTAVTADSDVSANSVGLNFVLYF